MIKLEANIDRLNNIVDELFLLAGRQTVRPRTLNMAAMVAEASWMEDNDPGFTAEQQAQLFKVFSRVTETRVRGHGLGLSIVRRIAEKLDGQAGVTSEVDWGNHFWFELPAALSA